MFLDQIHDVLSNQRIVLGMISKMKTRYTTELKKGSNNSNFIKNLQHSCFSMINAKFLKTLILKNISEVAVCWRSSKSAYAGVPFQ